MPWPARSSTSTRTHSSSSMRDNGSRRTRRLRAQSCLHPEALRSYPLAGPLATTATLHGQGLDAPGCIATHNPPLRSSRGQLSQPSSAHDTGAPAPRPRRRRCHPRKWQQVELPIRAPVASSRSRPPYLVTHAMARSQCSVALVSLKQPIRLSLSSQTASHAFRPPHLALRQP